MGTGRTAARLPGGPDPDRQPAFTMNSVVKFRTIEPFFFSGLLDDPVLQVRVRPTGRSLLFDCGRIHHLAKRVLKSIAAIFVSHAHMDHFMGIDTFIRSVHVSPREVDIFGPPGLSDKMAAKLAGYDWNLCEPYWCSLMVHEIYDDHLDIHRFSGPEGFARRFLERRQRTGRAIYGNRRLLVEAEQCDHRIPSLIFRITEAPTFQVDMTKLENTGLIAGPWLRQLKKCYHCGNLEETQLTVSAAGDNGEKFDMPVNGKTLYDRIGKDLKPGSVGYVTDIGFTPHNLDTVCGLLSGVTLLVCECSFLADDREKARASSHLCTSDVNVLLDRLRPAAFMPMHLSKSYIHRPDQLYEELEIPPGVTLLRLPTYLTPRPLLSCEAARLNARPRR